MRVMALTATAFHNRLVFGNILLLAFHGVIVAFVAQLCHWLAQQAFGFRSMGIVTGQATFFTQQWPMQAILVEGLVDHVVVAPAAEADSFGLDLERSG